MDASMDMNIIENFFGLLGEILSEWVIQQDHAAEISTFVLNGFSMP